MAKQGLIDSATGKLISDADALYSTISGSSANQTGILTGGEVTINADPTKFDVAAGTAVVVDWTNPAVPVRTEFAFGPFVAQSVSNIGAIFTLPNINAAGALDATSGVLFTPQMYRTKVLLQVLVHQAGTVIESVGTNVIPAYNVTQGILDYVRALGVVNSGNDISANGVNLSIDKALGQTTEPFINYAIDKTSPSVKTNPADTLVTFTTSYEDGASGFTFESGQTLVRPDLFDDGDGTLGTVPNNQWTIKRCLYFGVANTLTLVMGQATYSSLSDAESAIFTEDPTISPLLEAGKFVTALIVKKGATDLSDPSVAKFVSISSGNVGGGGGIGDMLSSLYDPTAVGGDAFDMENMVEGATKKILTVAERAAIIVNTSKVTYDDQAAVSANTAKETNLIDSIVAGTNVTVDATDPKNPIVNSTGGGSARTVTPQTLTSTSNQVDTNVSVSLNAKHTTTEDFTLNNPTNMLAGETYSWYFTQGVTPRIITYGDAFDKQLGLTNLGSSTNLLIAYSPDGIKLVVIIMTQTITDEFWANVVLLFQSVDQPNLGTVFDDGSDSNHTITGVSSAAHSTAASKFDTSSLLADGVSDYWNVPDSEDFNFAAADFTIEFFVKHNSVSGVQTYLHQHSGSDANFWTIRLNTGQVQFTSTIASVSFVNISGGSMTTGWHFVQIRRLGDSFTIRIDDAQVDSVIKSGSMLNATSILSVGAKNVSGAVNLLDGYIEELRITEGVARTDTSVPTRGFPTS